MIARLVALATVAIGGCATIVGIDDHQPLACDQLYVIRDDGRRLDVFPPFESSVTDYRVIVSTVTIAVQVVISCRDPEVSITTDGLAPGADGRSPLIVLVEATTDIPIVVRAPTDPPVPEIDYHLVVMR